MILKTHTGRIACGGYLGALVLYTLVYSRLRFRITPMDFSLGFAQIVRSVGNFSHLLAYGGFAILAASLSVPAKRTQALFAVFGISVLMEALQIVLPAGTPRLADVLGNVVSVALGYGAFMLFVRRAVDSRENDAQNTAAAGRIPVPVLALASALSLTLVAAAMHFTTVVVAGNLRTPGVRAQALDPNAIAIRPSDLSPWQLDSLLKVEDPAFYSHHGVDLKTPGAGLTTITQAIGKVYYFDHYEQGFRKADLVFIARYVIDPAFTKTEQLTMFLNGEWFDDGVTGIVAAADYFYGKRVADLTQKEWLSIIAMYVGPGTYNLKSHPDTNADRVARIEQLLDGSYVPRNNADVYYGPERTGLTGTFDVLFHDIFGRNH